MFIRQVWLFLHVQLHPQFIEEVYHYLMIPYQDFTICIKPYQKTNIL